MRLNRPQSLNALDLVMVEELLEALETLAPSGARALLLTGQGRGFSSGADLISGGGLPSDAGHFLETHLNPLVERLFALEIPVVAAVNGPAAGAGCSIALAADIVIAGRSAYFLQAFVNVGLVPDAGATWLLPRLVGRARALEMMMLGDRVSAQQAADWGLISRVVPDEDLQSEAIALATRLAAGPTVALALIRQLAGDDSKSGLADALRAERVAQRRAGESADFKAAVLAFAEKRPAVFRGC